ncbi:MAG: 4-hydroxythreonine-4-phosphate dehydrogenase PdxA [Dysgonamonadaceae bacterium]|jgi:4-hydroxythreonine-4-phosphate dehydrogenase|nr:4-hydroxythreonine-4-phosphate dehydrogenase PdxA [Dysgonamonadaceae bacterium]
MSEKLIKIGIIQEDTRNINEEILSKTLEDIRLLETCTPVVYDSSNQAMLDLQSGAIDVLIFSSITEKVTAELEAAAKGQKALHWLLKDSFRIALATDKKVAGILTIETLTEKIKAVQSSLIHDFMVTLPRIAVLSLNPETDETIIVPAIKAASEAGIFCFGAYTADTFFTGGEYRTFDAIIALNLEQIHSVFQAITLDEGVRYLAGLPWIATAPDQDQNGATEEALHNATYLAIDLYFNRKLDKKIFANPLRKLYFERGSDNEKLDLTKEEA